MILDHGIVRIIRSVAADGPCIRLVFLVEFLLWTGHTSWNDSSDESLEAAVGSVDSLGVAFTGGGRIPVHGGVCLFDGSDVFFAVLG